MKIVIFGASGRTGRPLVEKALNAGHEVTAFVRQPAKLGIQHERLHVVQGEVQEVGKVEQAVAGQDVVISVLGPSSNQDNVMSRAAENIVTAMKQCGVKRLITLTGAGIEDPDDAPMLVNKVISFLLKTTARGVYEESLKHVNKVRASGLDWTVVRVPMLNDDPGKGEIKVGYVGKGTGTKITRQDVAEFILKQAEDRKFIGKAPMISN